MGSLYGSLHIALGALAADQGAVAITSNNIANVNTAGYTREQVNLSENSPVQVGNLLFGTGVTLGQTTSIRDNLLEQRLDQENQSASQLSAFLGPMNQIQALFNETSGAGLQTPLTAFFNSLSQLSANPSDPSLREGVITAGQNLASAFQQDSSNLQSLQSNTDLGVQQSVSQINTLTSQIASLNIQISGLVSVGQDAGTFQDQRTQLVRQLSGLIDVAQTDAGNGSVTITTSNGAALVVAGQSFALSTQVNANTTFQDVYSQGTDITSTITGGTLGGQIQVRDQEIPSILNKLDTFAYSLATSVNTQSRAGFDLNGNPGVNFFTAPASAVGAASSIAVAISDPNLVAASSDGSVGSNGNSQALTDLQNQTIVNGQTPANYYAGVVFQIGNDVSQATSEQQAVTLVQQQLQDQRGSISGVSLDEEAVNLIRFQSAYEASANVVSVVNHLLTTTIGMTGHAMSFRVNPNPAPDLLAAIALDRQAQNTALQQISTGRQVIQISDNPAAAADDVFNHIQSSQDDQYLQTISALTSQQQTADSALSSVVTAVTQAISLGIEGANSTVSISNQQAIAQQVTGIRDQVLSLANETYQGSYLFAGTATSTQPFVLDATQPNGVKYNGNNNVNSVTISAGSSIPTNVPGSQIFTNPAGDVIGSLNGLITALQTNTGIGAAVTSVQQGLSQLSTQRVFYGNALQQLKSAQTFLNSDKVQLSTQENALVGVDLAAAATNLSQSTTATNAILAASNQILSTLNLLNYLK